MTAADRGTPRRPWLYAGVGTLTGATLILELTLTRIFSVVMYYHFAFLAISLALFGLGFAGTWLYLRPALTAPARFPALLHRYSLYSAGAAVIALLVVLNIRVGLKFESHNLWLLTVVYLAAAVPFFFAGLCVSLAVMRQQADMGRLYFWDLCGAGLGCLLLVPLLDLLGGPGAVLFSGVLFLAANLMFGRATGHPRPLLRLLPPAVLAAGLLALTLVEATVGVLPVPSVKGTNEQNVVFDKWNSFSRVTVEQTRGDHHWLKMDSSAATRIFSGAIATAGFQPSRRFSETKVASLVYNLKRPGTALIIGPGGGADVIAALYFGIEDVLGVELNPIIVDDVMRGAYREYSGDLYGRDDVTVVVDEGRSHIRGSDRRFASIQATLVDTWAATAAGAFTLSENNLYTHQAFADYLLHLEDDGVLTMTRWKHHDEFLRLLVLCRAALDDPLDAAAPAQHLYVAADHRMATFLLKKTPFTAAEIATLNAAVERDKLKRIYSPGGNERNGYAEFIRTEDWRAYVDRFPRDISPPPDNRPFFFYTVKPGDALDVLGDPGRLTRDNLGLLLLLVLVAVVGGLVLVFLLLPLFLFRREVLRGDRLGKARFLLYFVALGAGFITVEIAAMQKFVLFLGHPMYALVVILFALLVFSGVGSFLVRDVPAARIRRVAVRNLGLLALLLILDLLVLFPLFYAFASLPLFVRALTAVAYMAPLGLLMGSFLPLGVRAAGERFGALVPWAWGMNGAASVLGSVLTIALAMNLGFNLTLVVGLGFYGLGFLAWQPGAGRVTAEGGTPMSPLDSWERRLSTLERENRSLKLWLVLAVLTAAGALALAVNATLQLAAPPPQRERARIEVLPTDVPPGTPRPVRSADGAAAVQDDISWSRNRKSWQADGIDAVMRKNTGEEVSQREQVNALIRSRQRELVECVQAEQRRNEKFSGAFQVVFDVEPTGQAGGVALSQGTRGSSELTACLEGRLSRWRFPTFQGPAYQVRLPFNISR